MTTSWTVAPSGTSVEGIEASTGAAASVGSAVTRPGIVTKDMYPPSGLLDGELEIHAQLRPSWPLGIERNCSAIESVSTGWGSVIVVVGDNDEVASSVPSRGFVGSVMLRTTSSPSEVAESMCRVTEDTVAFCCSLTTMVTEVSSRN